MSTKDWSDRENRLVVADYFEMLLTELRGEPFNKSASNHALRALLDDRSHGSVEFKRANISAVLSEMGSPIVDGYKPRGNYQDSLVAAVDEHLESSPGLRAIMDGVAALEPEDEDVFGFATPDRQIDPPSPVVREKPLIPYSGPRVPVRFNYAERDAANRRLGELGERFILGVERARLMRFGCDGLASRVEWVSRTRGDGLGYDIQSFEPNGSETLIEVKTTNFGVRSPFIISRNEVGVSEAEGARYRLYRVIAFARDPRYYVLSGPVSGSCELLPRSYWARVAG